MPELPEVETIRRCLTPLVVGRTITAVRVYEKRLRFPLQPVRLKKWLAGSAILRLERRGKYLLWRMSNDASLLVHLGMSGRLSCEHAKTDMETHTHVVLDLDNGMQIRYRDPRRFGCMLLWRPGEREPKVLTHLGVEPLAADFTAEYLQSRAGRSMRAIKTVLLDGRVVTGIGNIYASETLFHAALAPQRPAHSLTLAEWRALRDAAVQVLQQAIDKGGTTLNDYRNGLGEPGFFQIELAVYGRENEPCLRCKQPVQRLVQQGRSSFYCPVCQR